ncbi:MucR family transcriptional regulator [Methylobacterium sp. J-068]|uniref:MucR family transcriptional regulator n=1 Tax=Methylobacterium sp. J-068 TaxID=2836649 RepID=UPI001FBA7B86|nr:MucR family transcriptional regulator [Methylobacterium sp. J-068]MCJ2035241.1 MucR family transcriptional regulator [Methylobacterium sp. J-068]
MSEKLGNTPFDHVELISNIISSYASNNILLMDDLTTLIVGLHAVVGGLLVRRMASLPTTKAVRPSAAQVRKSITPDGLISFEDGACYKILRRHLTARGLTPETYRAKYGLSDDYPMTAPSYSARRSELARTFEPWRHCQRSPTSTASSAQGEREASPKPEHEIPPRRRGRPRKLVTVE